MKSSRGQVTKVLLPDKAVRQGLQAAFALREVSDLSGDVGRGFCVGFEGKRCAPDAPCGALAVRKRLCHYDSELCAQACFSKLS